MILKRTKSLEGPPPDKAVVTNTHYATSIDKSGVVLAWGASANEACPVTEEMIAKVRATYEKALADKSAGKFELVKGDGKPADVAPPPPAAADAAVKLLQQEISSLRGELASIKAEQPTVGKLQADLTEARAENGKLLAEIEKLKKAKPVPAPAG